MRIIPFAIIVSFDRFSRLRHAKSHEGISAQKLINARKIPGVSDTGPKEGRVPFSHVCTPRVRNSTSFSLQGSPLFSFFFFFSSFGPWFLPLFDQLTAPQMLEIIRGLSLSPPWRSTSRRMTCASRDVTSMCHENPRDVEGQGDKR